MKNLFKSSFLLTFSVVVSLLAYTACSKEDSSEKNLANEVPTCGDKIKNQGEFKVDCGGTCKPCALAPSMTAVIDSFWVDPSMRGNGAWAADTVSASDSLTDGLLIYGSDINLPFTITFLHTQAYRRGVYVYDDIEGTASSCDLMDGIVEITAIDTVYRVVSGHFSFNCLGFTTNRKERIINGTFTDLTY